METARHGQPDRAAGAGMTSTRHALLGWLVLALLGAAGATLLAVAAAAEAQAWPALVYFALAAAVLAVYGLRVQAGRRLRARLRRAEARSAETEAALAAAFSHLGSGDLLRGVERTARLPAGLGDAFAAAARSLADVAEQIQDSSLRVAAAADGVDRLCSDLASGASQQAASAVEITAAMEELAQTAAQIAANTARQEELVDSALVGGEAGARAVEEAAAGVEDVGRRIAGIAGRADTLGSRAKDAYRVLELITEIAQETHLVSLNAAIEATAAGEDGRRFAVVAGEVRRLAHRAQESVASVRGLLDDFAAAVRGTVVATEEGGKEAARVVERARAAAAAIAALRETGGETAAAARQIALATRQQTAAADDVVTTLRETSQVVQRMSAGLRQLAATAARLKRLGFSIQLVAQTFHSDSPRSLKHLIEQWSHELQGARGDELAVHLDALVQDTPFIEMGYIADAEGRLLALCHSKRLGAEQARLSAEEARQVDMRHRPWFRSVARERRTSLTPLYDSLQSHELCFTIATPIAAAGGDLAAVLGMDVNLSSWTET
jgi:methyl-accepting chemotaxis protein